MSTVPDPELSLDEAMTLSGVVRWAAGQSTKWANDAVLNAAHEKLHNTAVAYHLEHPGALDEVQERLELRRALVTDIPNPAPCPECDGLQAHEAWCTAEDDHE